MMHAATVEQKAAPGGADAHQQQWIIEQAGMKGRLDLFES